MTTETVDGRPIPDAPDLARMRRERIDRLQSGLEGAGLDGLVLIGTTSVSYATGALAPAADSSRAVLARPVAVVVRGEDWPHLYTPHPDGVAPEWPADRVHPPLFPDLPDGEAGLRQALGAHFRAGARIGFDDMTHHFRAVTADFEVAGAAAVMAGAKLSKTPDELACIRTAQSINERAMEQILPAVRPGVRQCDLTARFVSLIRDLGATANCIDPIWQPMPTSLAAGPWVTHGGVAFPTGSYDSFLREGDVLWVDTGIGYHGYASDFGRTWIVSEDPRPTARQRGQYRRWADVTGAVLDRVKPGANGLELCRAAVDANGGTRPWVEHFYLAHGVGTDSAEMPLIGTDLGDAFDEKLVLAPGMVLVLEPVIWDDGEGGYRSEDMYAVTDGGWAALSDFPMTPFGSRS